MYKPRNVFSLDGHISYKNHHKKYRPNYHKSGPMMDAIVVPHGREASSIERSALLASAAGIPLVSLSSHNADFRQVAEFLEGMQQDTPLTYYAVNFHDGFEIPNSDIRAQEEIPPFATKPESFDLPQKRDAGLFLGERILYLDDDLDIVRRLMGLKAIAAALEERAIAGPSCNPTMPDRSVIQHSKLALLKYHMNARNYSIVHGVSSGQLSGNSMAVNTSLLDGHFVRRIYNEDLILDDPNRRARMSSVAPARYTQDVYDPYNPIRAAEEEFGDNFLDGLTATDDDETLLSKRHWQRQLDSRMAEYDWSLSNLGASRNGKYANYMVVAGDPNYFEPMPKEQQEKIGNALRAGCEILIQLESKDFVNYKRAWDEDRARWNKMKRAQPKRDIKQGLGYLGLNEYITNAA